ncbi:MAG: hypothetical protein V3V16_01000 [Melioribacteraceae bacterium]
MFKPKLLLLLFMFLALLIFSQCCSSKEKIKEESKMEKNQIQKSIPRSMIDASCTIIKVFEENNTTFCSVKIDTVHGYGGGVRSLAEGVNYKVEIDKNVLQKIKLNDNIGNILRCRLISMPSGMGQESKNRMKIVSVNK